MLNWFANYLKVGGIRVADLLNRLFDPYEEFTRPVNPKYEETLKEKARKFELDMRDFFWSEKSVYLYTLPGNSGDQCLWHGMYAAMWSLKYAVTKDVALVSTLEACSDGLWAHQSPRLYTPRLIRGWRLDGSYEDEVSNDQASGHLLGIYFLWRYGPVDVREDAQALAASLANELIAHNNCLVNEDGSPTKHGRLENGLKTDPLNLTLALAIYRVAYRLTRQPLYKQRYDELVKKYRPMIPYANARLLWWEKTHHAHRAAIHYSILCDLEDEHDLHRLYMKGLLRTWSMERKSGNPWIYYLLRRVCLYDPADLENAKKHLAEFTLEDKQYNVERVNSPSEETFKWGKYLRVRQPLPRWKVGSQDFFWQRHLYSADDWAGNLKGDIRHNGGDFLVAYWGLRSLRLITGVE